MVSVTSFCVTALLFYITWMVAHIVAQNTSSSSTSSPSPGRSYDHHWYPNYDNEHVYPIQPPPFHGSHSCICVPYHLCKTGGIDSDGAGDLDPRMYPIAHPGHNSKCHGHFICCPIVHNVPTAVPTTTTTTTTTTTSIPQYWGCGIRNRQGLPDVYILRPNRPNEEAYFGEFPWQAAIIKHHGHWVTFICGATLIDPRFVLTAAHCIKSYVPSNILVRLGEWDTRNATVVYPRRDIHVYRIVIHPEFNPWNLQNDLAIVILDSYVPFSPHIIPLCLPTLNENFDGLRCVVTGWGRFDDGFWGRYQNILKKVEVPIVNNTACQTQLRNTRLGPNFILDARFICAGGEEARDACKGDGGGPLACERGGVYRLAGVVSWGIGCGQRNVSGVYVRVSNYITWILNVIQEEQVSYDSHYHGHQHNHHHPHEHHTHNHYAHQWD